MVRIGCDFSKLGKTKPMEYFTRLLFGCALTLLFSIISKWAGAVIGGLFLAFPGIYPPGSSFVEKKEEERKEQAGMHGTKRARSLAGAHAVGAAAGTFGLMGFAASVWLGLPRFGLAPSLAIGTLSWFVLSVGAWALRERM